MAQAFTTIRIHVIFSTAGRRKWIREDLQEELWRYFAGVSRNYEMKLLKAGGMEDHVHLLLSLPPNLDVSKAVQVIKANSSRWLKTKQIPDFGWQRGYGAFSVSASQVNATIAYIHNQKKHHAKRSFKDEFIQFLEANGVEYDPETVFD